VITLNTPYRTESVEGVAREKRERYDYPEGLNLQPDHDQHGKIVQWVMRRARKSYSVIQEKFPIWDKLDESCTAYIRTDEAERLRQQKDPRKPTSIVMPITYTIHQTLLTQLATAGLRNPFFRYRGQSPEDHVGAVLMEKVIDSQFQRSKGALNIYTMWSDALKYGFGGVAVSWEREMGQRMAARAKGFWSTSFGPEPQWWDQGVEIAPEPAMRYEGNRFMNIDPRRYLPDTNVPVHDVQAGEFTAWVERTNYNHLLMLERQGVLFNVKYLKRIGDARSKLIPRKLGEPEQWDLDAGGRADDTRPCDVIWMHARIVPKDCELGDSEDVENWIFGVVADGLLIMAEKAEHVHGMFPIGVCAPNYDGHSIAPVSDLEVTYGSQKLCDWLLNSHVNSMTQLIKNLIIYDPSRINSEDMNTPGRSLVRARRRAFETNMRDSIFQLPMNDVTQKNMGDIQMMMDFMKGVTGATDGLMGMDPNAPERRSASEASGLRQSALARVNKIAMLCAYQAQNDLAILCAEHTQQYMSQQTWAKTIGTWPQALQMQYGPTAAIPVQPQDIVVQYDVLTTDSGINGGQHIDVAERMFQTVATNPELMQLFDVGRMFLSLADLAGYPNASEFLRAGGGIAPQVQGQEQIEADAQAGNIIPVAQVGLA
jgi:hypothetical protein